MFAQSPPSLISLAGQWAIQRGYLSAAAMQGYGAAWVDNYWRMVPGFFMLVVLSVYWKIADRNDAPARQAESGWSRALHVAAVNLALVSMMIPLPGLFARILPDTATLVAIGWGVSGLGLVFAILARRRLGRNWSGEVRIAEDQELVRSGPYRFVRHPIYTGIMTLYAGLFLSSGRVNAFIGFTLFALAYWRKIALEERLLAQRFGADFETYRRRSWAILPPLL